MLLEVLRMSVDAMEHATTGVNAQLKSLSIDAGDERPPPVRAVLDRTRDDLVARGEMPADFPIVLVTQIGPAQASGEVSPVPGRRDAESVPIGFAYVVRDASTSKSVRNTLYTIRAIVRAIRAWLDDSRVDDQERNGVCIMVCTSLTYDEANEDLGEGTVAGYVTATFSVRDTEA